MADIQYGYNPGGATLSTTAPGGGGGGLPDMTALLRWAAQKEAEKQQFARQQALAASGREDLQTLSGIQDAATRRAMMTNPAPGPAAPAETPFFVKMQGGGGGSAGYRPAQGWEPGAVSGGTLPAGVNVPSPNSATVHDSQSSQRSAGEDLDFSDELAEKKRRFGDLDADNENARYQKRVWDLRHGA